MVYTAWCILAWWILAGCILHGVYRMVYHSTYSNVQSPRMISLPSSSSFSSSVPSRYNCDCQNVPDDCHLSRFATENKCNMANGCDWDEHDGRCETYGCVNITSKTECIQGYHKCVWSNATTALSSSSSSSSSSPSSSSASASASASLAASLATPAAAGSCVDPPGPAPVCNRSLVGFLNLSNVNWGRDSHHDMSTVDYWHGNTLAKSYGYWYVHRLFSAVIGLF